MTKHVLFLMSDTGGGHRAAAEAIRDALYIKYGPENVQADLVDVFKIAQFPLNYMPEFYPWIVNHSKTGYGMGYKLSNSRRRAALLSRSIYLSNARRFKRMLTEYNADVLVSVHSVITRPIVRTLRALDERPPFVTVVTDLVSTHMFWYDRSADLTIVPTRAAYERGLKAGLQPDKMREVGLPVHPSFTQSLTSMAEARAELGWDMNKPTILLVAGGDGMGRLDDTTAAINAQGLDCQLAIVTGRNTALRKKLEHRPWNQPTYIYGFVNNMPTLMAAADIMVTKAGPATITEAGIAGLPMIIYDAIPGQEDGNVTHVIEKAAGVYAPDPEEVAATVAAWLNEGQASLKLRADAARRVANPDAVWQIADAVWTWAHHGAIPNTRKNLLQQTLAMVTI